MKKPSISKVRDPKNFSEHIIDVARRGGTIAKEAREKLEAETGKKIVSPTNAVENHHLLHDGKPSVIDEDEESK